MKDKVIMKTDSSANWAKCEEKYIPVINTIIVYQDQGRAPRIKMSDGIHTLKELPFINPQTEVNDNTLKFK